VHRSKKMRGFRERGSRRFRRNLVKMAQMATRTVDASSASQTNEAVVAFLRTLDHPLKKEIVAVRKAILGASAHIREGIKWNAPSFRTEKDYFATFHLRSTDEVELVLHRGAKVRIEAKALEVADPRGLLKWLGKDRALMKLGAGRVVTANRPALEAIVRAWVELV
jgi:hypothetical protein